MKQFVEHKLPEYGDRTVYFEVINETPTFFETRKYASLGVVSNSESKKGMKENKIRWPKKDVKVVKFQPEKMPDISQVYYAEDSKE